MLIIIKINNQFNYYSSFS